MSSFKGIKKSFFAVVVLCIVMVLLFVFSINFAENEEKIGSYDSPSGTYTLIAYETNGGATTSFGLVCKLCNNNCKFFPKRKIFVEYPSYGDPDVVWEDDDTLIINGERIENVLIDKATIYHTKPTPSESTEG